MKITFPTMLLLISAGAARAVTVQVDLAAEAQQAYPGTTVSYAGTVTSVEPGVVDLNGINITFTGQGTSDPTPFYSGPPTVGALSATGSFTLFNVTVGYPYTDSYGPLYGTFTILGGLEGVNGYDPNLQDIVASGNFEVDVVAAPEPRPAEALPLGLASLCVLTACGRRGKAFRPGGSETGGFRP